MIRTVLADDHQVFNEGLAAMISASGMNVVGVISDRDQLLDVITRERPDVAVVDVSMPGIGIPELLSLMRRRDLATHVLVLTADDDPRLAEEMLQAGVRGYMLKEHAFAEILSAIESVAAGRSFLSSQLAAQLLESKQAVQAQPWTDRQLEILRLVAEGDTTKRIAAKLGIHVKTVDSHRQRIREKLGAHSSAEMVRIAIQRGLV